MGGKEKGAKTLYSVNCNDDPRTMQQLCAPVYSSIVRAPALSSVPTTTTTSLEIHNTLIFCSGPQGRERYSLTWLEIWWYEFDENGKSPTQTKRKPAYRRRNFNIPLQASSISDMAAQRRTTRAQLSPNSRHTKSSYIVVAKTNHDDDDLPH